MNAEKMRLSPNLRGVLSLRLGVRIDWHVGDVVRKLREAKRWNQARLAEVAKLNKGTVVSVEEGANVKVETMEAVSRALGLTMAQLYALLPAEQETVQLKAVAGETFRSHDSGGSDLGSENTKRGETDR